MQAIITKCTTNQPELKKDYCIIGAGPSGLQLGYFLHKAGRDYLIFERTNTSGAFFIDYPRHRTMISINKRNTGKTNKEFNLRHDWNSLLSDDDSLQMRHYSGDFFPHADMFLKYLQDYTKKLGINVKYNTNIVNVKSINITADQPRFQLQDHFHNIYECKTVIVGTGLSLPNNPYFKGFEHTVGYEDMSIDKADYEGKTVLIMGKGNSGFETADNIIANTNYIHLISRTQFKLSWETHYVGDVRAVNSDLFDTFRLKSLDGIYQAPINELKLIKQGDKIYVDTIQGDVFELNSTVHKGIGSIDKFALRDPYDIVIRGVQVEPGIIKGKEKYPAITHSYEAVNVPGLFFTGTNTHSLDYKKSAGGFIHGFRYTARVLSRILEFRNHNVSWPSVTQPTTELLNHIVKRVNEASGTYHMYGFLGDVVILSKNATTYTYLEEFPINLIHQLHEKTGHAAQEVLVIVMEYGQYKNFQFIGIPGKAHLSYFLHPVLYYYDALPSKKAMSQSPARTMVLPRPRKIHHIVEDFLTDFTAPQSHILLLRRFLESCLQTDLRNLYDSQCFSMAMTSKSLSSMCRDYDYQLKMGSPGEFETRIPIQKRKQLARVKMDYMCVGLALTLFWTSIHASDLIQMDVDDVCDTDNNVCYKFCYNDKQNWTNARQVCDNSYDMMAVVNDVEVHRKIRKHINSQTDTLRECMGNGYWIGATDSVNEGQFVFTNGEPLPTDYEKWYDGQPGNSVQQDVAGQDCVQLW
uniref:FAD-dependent oxidoreductase domain-containing protein 2-like n=1 Tax=Saccoglossus kowalevskii TaxID=10224 RepID=A0ABM0M944_SACKO|nr:PREDICTED: FAD-dependent oxidoreductase domain-containing protein 2-like [Saccoglossus kowalevskii]